MENIALQLNAQEKFAATPEQNFTYGLNIFFPEKDIPLPYKSDIAIESSGTTIAAPASVRVLSLTEALQDKVLVKDLEKVFTTNPISDKMLWWLSANTPTTQVVVVPDNTILQEPITITTVLDAYAVAHRVIVIVGASSEACINEIRTGERGQETFFGALTTIVAKDNAKVIHSVQQDFDTKVTSFSYTALLTEAHARIDMTEYISGGSYAKSWIHADLTASGAETSIRTRFLGVDNEKYDLYTETRHHSPHTTAEICTKGVLAGRAKAIHRSLIHIDRDGAGASARQKSATLLLSPDAEVDTIPNLEVETHEVQCAHSATVGDIDAEQVFYIMSRGLNESQAKKTAVEGFFSENNKKQVEAAPFTSFTNILAERLEEIL